jgi:hypothetical protein
MVNIREDVAKCDDINMQVYSFCELNIYTTLLQFSDVLRVRVVNTTTPAQMFHLLRRQLIRPYRKPLIGKQFFYMFTQLTYGIFHIPHWRSYFSVYN